jgi:hypothetical protein
MYLVKAMIQQSGSKVYRKLGFCLQTAGATCILVGSLHIGHCPQSPEMGPGPIWGLGSWIELIKEQKLSERTLLLIRQKTRFFQRDGRAE